jgi:hypothetical protein
VKKPVSFLQGETVTRTWLLFAFSFLIHLGVVLAIGHYKNPVLWENGMIADYLFSGRGFCGDFSIQGEQTSWQAPGYPYLLCWSWGLFGKGASACLFISIAQCLLLASMIWPMTALSRRWFSDVPIWIVQVLTILAPLYLWYGTRLHHTSIVMALHPWILWGWLEQVRKGFFPAILVGFSTGIFALFQPVVLGVFGIIGLVLLGEEILARHWQKALLLMLGGATVLITLIPWTIRNYHVQGRIVLIKDSFGKEFWMGNNPHATGTGYAVGGAEEITNLYPPACFSQRGFVKEVELMDAMGHEASSWISSHPAEFVKLMACKLWWLWTVPPKDRVRTTGAAEAILFRGVYLGYWMTLIALSLIGIIFSRPLKEYSYLLILFIMMYSLVYGLTHVGQARFRGEIEYLFFPAAAAGLFCLLRGGFSKRGNDLKT